ncbi:MAG: hypothetical protein BWY15_01790 [Firmicutes bacterium ADurb.Bin193]|nr:MAG: hypothetical protein BWY15_01790 [Firmicutes bacterium ADurb.Bin193]
MYRKILGIEYDDLISFTLDDNRLIVKKEKVCDGCKNRKADVLELKELAKALSLEEKYQLLALLTSDLGKEHQNDQSI